MGGKDVREAIKQTLLGFGDWILRRRSCRGASEVPNLGSRMSVLWSEQESQKEERESHI